MSDKLSQLLACSVFFSPTTHASLHTIMHAQMLHFLNWECTMCVMLSLQD